MKSALSIFMFVIVGLFASPVSAQRAHHRRRTASSRTHEMVVIERTIPAGFWGAAPLVAPHLRDGHWQRVNCLNTITGAMQFIGNGRWRCVMPSGSRGPFNLELPVSR